jgi:hypothetical protein
VEIEPEIESMGEEIGITEQNVNIKPLIFM